MREFMNYKEILKNRCVQEQYNEIDKINPFPFNHGLKHVQNVCKIMEKLCNVLKINGEKKEALLIACALHDIGQVDGREKHGLKAKEFTIRLFSSEIEKNPFALDILDSIEKHDDLCSIDKSLFCILVQFCDKMDFSKERLENNYREKFRYYCYEDILKINFIYDMKEFGIDIVTNDIHEFESKFLSENFSKKVINAVEILATKLNCNPFIMVNGKKLEY